MATSEGIGDLREQIFDNAAFLYNNQANDAVRPQEIFSIVMLCERKKTLDIHGRVQPYAAPGSLLVYQAIVTHIELLTHKISARGDLRETVHEALESLLEGLARRAAGRVFSSDQQYAARNFGRIEGSEEKSFAECYAGA